MGNTRERFDPEYERILDAREQLRDMGWNEIVQVLYHNIRLSEQGKDHVPLRILQAARPYKERQRMLTVWMNTMYEMTNGERGKKPIAPIDKRRKFLRKKRQLTPRGNKGE